MNSDEMPIYATSDERVVEIQGEALKVLKALEAVIGHLRKFLVDHSVLPLFEKSVSLLLFLLSVYYQINVLLSAYICYPCSFHSTIHLPLRRRNANLNLGLRGRCLIRHGLDLAWIILLQQRGILYFLNVKVSWIHNIILLDFHCMGKILDFLQIVLQALVVLEILLLLRFVICGFSMELYIVETYVFFCKILSLVYFHMVWELLQSWWRLISFCLQ